MSKHIETKRENEKALIQQMIGIYCKCKHKTKNGLCEDCSSLLEYSHLRINRCPFMESKTFCSNCTVHCFRNEQREQIKKVMVFSGKRMIFHHPLIAINHVIQVKKQKRELEKRNDQKNNPKSIK